MAHYYTPGLLSADQIPTYLAIRHRKNTHGYLSAHLRVDVVRSSGE